MPGAHCALAQDHASPKRYHGDKEDANVVARFVIGESRHLATGFTRAGIAFDILLAKVSRSNTVNRRWHEESLS